MDRWDSYVLLYLKVPVGTENAIREL